MYFSGNNEEQLPPQVISRDVKELFLKAAEDLPQEGLVAGDDFSLHDAMMSIEIMDPRMDTGVILPEHQIPENFEFYSPLLPEELCWIMDRTFAAEMAWHGGRSLAQTVYTCQYVGDLPSFGIQIGLLRRMWPQNPSTPIELVLLVLKAHIYGLLKTCDLVWRELTKGHVNEMEDFIGEKSEVFLCETIQVPEILQLLHGAKQWLLSDAASELPWRMQLLSRIELRVALLTALSYQLPRDRQKIVSAIRLAKAHLKYIRTGQAPGNPEPSSPASQVFDKAIIRNLITVMPVPVIDLPSQAQAWDDYEGLLSGLEEACSICEASDALAIFQSLSFRTREAPGPHRTGFIRAYTQTALFAPKPTKSLSTRYVLAMTGASPRISLHDWLLQESFSPVNSDEKTPLARIIKGEQKLEQLLEIQAGELEIFSVKLERYFAEYLGTFLCNRPRQRRKLFAIIPDWTELCLLTQRILEMGILNQPDRQDQLTKINLFLRLTRIQMILQVIFSGIETNLYGSDEFAYMFWYIWRISGTARDIARNLAELCGFKEGTYIHWLSIYLHAINCLSRASVVV